MNLKHLEYFLKVVEVGSITQAALALRMSQPALSRQVRVFEDEMGWKLFERGAKTIELTHAGGVVLREGKKMLAAVERGITQIKREVDGGVIRVGYAPSLAGGILKKAMGCFMQRHPQVGIQLFDASTEEMRMGLLERKFDLIIEVANQESGFEWQKLTEQKLGLALSVEHPVLGGKQRKKVKVGELDGERFLLLSRIDYPTYWGGVAKYFRENDVDVKVAGEFDGIESMAVAIEAGLGMAFVAQSARFNESVVVARLEPEPEPVCVAVGWDGTRAQDAITMEFVEELRMAAE